MAPIFDPSSYGFSWFAVPVLVVGLLNWLLGFATFIRERGSRPSLTLLAMTFVIGVWLLGLSAAYSSTDPGVALAWIKVSLIGTVFVPVAAFVNAATGTSRLHVMRVLSVVGCAVSCLLTLLILDTHLVLDHVHHYRWGYYPIYGSLGPILIAYYCTFFVGGGLLYRIGQQSTKSEKNKTRMRVRFAALTIAIPATVDFLATMSIAVYPFGYVFVMGYISLSTFSVWRNRLVDITPALAARQIIDTMAEGLLVFDRDGIARVANDAAQRLCNTTRSLVGVTCAEIDRGWIGGSLASLLDPDEQSRIELAFDRPESDTGTALVSSAKLCDSHGAWVGTVCMMHDITERQRAEAAVHASEAMYRALVETSPDGVIVTNRMGEVAMINRRALELVGSSGETGQGTNALQFIAGQDRERLRATLANATGSMVVTTNDEYVIARTDGSSVPVELSISIIPGGDDNFRFMAVIRDISERKRNEQEIRYLAFHDSLTGAATRSVMVDRLANGLSRAQRSGTIVGIIFLDLDHFKEVNDTKGHDAGDATLRCVGDVLQSVLREGDTLARVGGDEFVLLLPDLQSVDDLTVVAARILARMRRAAADGMISSVTASLGLATYPRDGTAPDELLRHADAAMYRTKSHGGDGYQLSANADQPAA